MTARKHEERIPLPYYAQRPRGRRVIAEHVRPGETVVTLYKRRRSWVVRVKPLYRDGFEVVCYSWRGFCNAKFTYNHYRTPQL